MSEETQEKEWIAAHEKAIEMLKNNPREHWRTLWAFYQDVKVPEDFVKPLFEAFYYNVPAGAPAGLKEQARELDIEVDEK